MAKRKRKALGAPTKHHANLASTFATNADLALKRMKPSNSCSLQLTDLHTAVGDIAKAWSHGFGSGGRVHKGALSKRTVSESEAKRIYDIDERVTEAVSRFRRDCVKR